MAQELSNRKQTSEINHLFFYIEMKCIWDTWIVGIKYVHIYSCNQLAVVRHMANELSSI